MKIFDRKKISLVLAIAFIGFLIWSSVEFQSFFARIVPFFESLTHKNPVLSVWVFVLLAMTSTTLASFSSVPLVPIAIIVWGNNLVALYLFVGWLLGDILAYFIGYSAGKPLVQKLVPYDRVKKYMERIPPHAEFKLILLFILSTPSEVPGYVIGTLRYKFLKYFAATTINEVIYASLTAYAGAALVKKNLWVFSGSVIFFVVSYSYAFYLLNKYLRRSARPTS